MLSSKSSSSRQYMESLVGACASSMCDDDEYSPGRVPSVLASCHLYSIPNDGRIAGCASCTERLAWWLTIQSLDGGQGRLGTASRNPSVMTFKITLRVRLERERTRHAEGVWSTRVTATGSQQQSGRRVRPRNQCPTTETRSMERGSVFHKIHVVE